MNVDRAKRLKKLNAENARFKRAAAADLTVDKVMLEEVTEGTY